MNREYKLEPEHECDLELNKALNLIIKISMKHTLELKLNLNPELELKT